MNPNIPFDTLSYATSLVEAGVPTEIASAHAKANSDLISGLISNTLATKSDVHNLEQRISYLEQHMESRFREVDLRFQNLEHRLTVKLGALMSGSLAIFATLVSVLHLVH